MVSRKNKLTLGIGKHKQKNISNKMINIIEQHKKKMQLNENIRYGRKAKVISFVIASDDLAKRIGE